MANELKMATVQSILSLRAQGWSHQRIAGALGIDRGTVSRHLRQAAQAAQTDSPAARSESGREDSNPANLPTGCDPKPSNLPTGSDPGDSEPRAGKPGTTSVRRKKAPSEPPEACQA